MRTVVLEELKRIVRKNASQKNTLWQGREFFHITSFGWLDDGCKDAEWCAGACHILANLAEKLAETSEQQGYVAKDLLSEIISIAVVLEATQ